MHIHPSEFSWPMSFAFVQQSALLLHWHLEIVQENFFLTTWCKVDSVKKPCHEQEKLRAIKHPKAVQTEQIEIIHLLKFNNILLLFLPYLKMHSRCFTDWVKQNNLDKDGSHLSIYRFVFIQIIIFLRS